MTPAASIVAVPMSAQRGRYRKSAKPIPKAELARQAARAAIWRSIRDAGAQGLKMAQIVALHGAHGVEATLYARVHELDEGRFIERKTKFCPWVVTGDCRVPKGETPVLGPGWTGDDACLVGRPHQVSS